MLKITNLDGETEILSNIVELKRDKKVNGEKILNLRVVPSAINRTAYSYLENESIVTFDNEQYIVKNVNEESAGELSIKNAELIHIFYDKMINYQYHELFTGTMTLNQALTRVFSFTDYSFVVIGSFPSQYFENFGRDNKLALFQQVLERYNVEFKVVGDLVYIQAQIGSNVGFQFRWKYNVKALDKEVDTKNLATTIYGFGGKPDEAGDYPLVVQYPPGGESPSIDKFGFKEADAYYNENITNDTTMLAALERILIDEPQLSITIDIADLGADVIEGDSGYIVYEPMDITVSARVVEIIERFYFINNRWKRIKCEVTLSNIREKLTDITTRFEQTSKSVNRLFSGLGTISSSVLDAATRAATDMLKAAQTQIIFSDIGLIGQDPDNENYLTVLTSRGFGVSTDGGDTFDNAITALGINTNLLTAGTINTDQINIFGGDDDTWIEINGETMDVFGTYSRSWFGVPETLESQITVGNGYVRLSKLNDPEGRRNLYLSNNGLSTYLNGANTDEGFGSGVVEFWSKMYDNDRRGLTMYSNLGSVALRTSSRDIYLDSDRDVNIWASSGVVRVQPRDDSRTGNNHFIFDVKLNDDTSQQDGVIKYGSPLSNYASGLRFSKASADPIVFVTNGNGDFGTGDLDAHILRARGHLLGSVMAPVDNIYLMVDTEVRVTNKSGFNDGGTITYKPIRASDFITASSQVFKENVEEWNIDALAVIKKMKQYKWTPKNNSTIYSYGDVIEDTNTPDFLKVENGINNTSKLALHTLGIKQLIKEVEALKNDVIRIKKLPIIGL